jgi:hypothetical protein
MPDGLGGEPIEPAGDGHASGSRGAQAEKVATVHSELPDSFSGQPKSSGAHACTFGLPLNAVF